MVHTDWDKGNLLLFYAKHVISFRIYEALLACRNGNGRKGLQTHQVNDAKINISFPPSKIRS